MANIYLRLPTPVAYFQRNRWDVPLHPDEPLRFCDFDEKMRILRMGLVRFDERQLHIESFSQQEWRNMQNGRRPNGEKVDTKRDNTIPLSYNEVVHLSNFPLRKTPESYDYICIQMPREVQIGRRVYATNPSFSLDGHHTHLLQKALCADYKRAIVAWVLHTRNYQVAPDAILDRRNIDTLERFLMHYGIPTSSDNIERDSLRRQLKRWLIEVGEGAESYNTLDIAYYDPNDRVIQIANPDHIDQGNLSPTVYRPVPRRDDDQKQLPVPPQQAEGMATAIRPQGTTPGDFPAEPPRPATIDYEPSLYDGIPTDYAEGAPPPYQD